MTDNYNEQEFDDLDLEQSIEQAAPPLDPLEDPNAKRYGLSFLVNIPLYKHIGNYSMIEANKLNEAGEVIKNRKYFPRLTLIPFKTIFARVPAEATASRTSSSSYEAHSRPFNPDSADAQDLKRVIEKSSMKCAEFFTNTYGDEGGMIIDNLTGIETWKEARDILSVVLPLNDPRIFPVDTRRILGEEFRAPFLDTILAFLQSNAPRERIEQLTAGKEHAKQRLLDIYFEVLAGARNANTIAKSQISESESDMAATPQRKSGYDVRDTKFKDAPDPFDLVCLANLNELPKSDRQLAQARKMQETNNEPMLEVARSMKEVAEQMRNSPPPAQIPNVAVGLTAAEIKELISEGIREGIEERMTATAASEDVKTADSDEAAPPVKSKRTS